VGFLSFVTFLHAFLVELFAAFRRAAHAVRPVGPKLLAADHTDLLEELMTFLFRRITAFHPLLIGFVTAAFRAVFLKRSRRPVFGSAILADTFCQQMSFVFLHGLLFPCLAFRFLLFRKKLMVVNELLFIQMLVLALWGAHDLLTVDRPERFTADNAILLLECVIAFLCISFGFNALGSGSVQALLRAILLFVAVGPVFLSAVNAYSLGELVTFVFAAAFLLFPCPVLLLRFLLSGSPRFLDLFFLFSGSSDFFLGEGKIELADEVEENLKLLRSVLALAAVRLMDNDLINQIVEHIVG
jgi:hypothetical protein